MKVEEFRILNHGYKLAIPIVLELLSNFFGAKNDIADFLIVMNIKENILDFAAAFIKYKYILSLKRRTVKVTREPPLSPKEQFSLHIHTSDLQNQTGRPTFAFSTYRHAELELNQKSCFDKMEGELKPKEPLNKKDAYVFYLTS